MNLIPQYIPYETTKEMKVSKVKKHRDKLEKKINKALNDFIVKTGINGIKLVDMGGETVVDDGCYTRVTKHETFFRVDLVI